MQSELKKISADSGMLRLKRGVMKYIAAPGKLELEIYEYCSKQGIESTLWPQMDTYDIQIIFPSGTVWAVDAKMVREPYFLREKIRSDKGFPDGEYKRGFYVIPDEYVKERPDYLDIINKELQKIGNPNVRCVRWCDLKKAIKGRG